MVLNQTNRVDSNCGCNSGKCCNCAFSLICSKSPYCRLKDDNESSFDFQSVLDMIGSGFSYLNGRFDMVNKENSDGLLYMNNHIDSFFQNFNNIQDAIIDLKDLQIKDFSYVNNRINEVNTLLSDKIDSAVSEINLKLDNILDKLSNLGTSNIVDMDSFDSNGLVPYNTSSNDETVLVEKKGIFGKTKWVEEKKK